MRKKSIGHIWFTEKEITGLAFAAFVGGVQMVHPPEGQRRPADLFGFAALRRKLLNAAFVLDAHEFPYQRGLWLSEKECAMLLPYYTETHIESLFERNTFARMNEAATQLAINTGLMETRLLAHRPAPALSAKDSRYFFLKDEYQEPYEACETRPEVRIGSATCQQCPFCTLVDNNPAGADWIVCAKRN